MNLLTAQEGETISIKKGQTVSLTKGRRGGRPAEILDEIFIGAGWEEQQRRGGDDFDVDASILMLESNGRFSRYQDALVSPFLTEEGQEYQTPCGSVTHMGDNKTGHKDDRFSSVDPANDDKEQICLKLSQVPKQFNRILVIASIYAAINRQQRFGMIRNAYMRIFTRDSDKPLIRYDLQNDYESATAIIIASIDRTPQGWTIQALSEASNFSNGLSDILNAYRKPGSPRFEIEKDE